MTDQTDLFAARPKRLPVVFVSGPFRLVHPHEIGGPFERLNSWTIAQNVRRAEAVALLIWLTGKAAPICPHAQTAHYQDTAPDHVWLTGDLELLLRSDAILMLDGWQESEGSRAELIEAERAGLFTFYMRRPSELPVNLLMWLVKWKEREKQS